MKSSIILCLSVSVTYCLLFGNGMNSKNEIGFVERYMQHKNLKYCTFLNCWPPEVVLSTMKEAKVFSRFWNIEWFSRNIDYDDQKNNMLNVLFYNCNGSLAALKKAAEMNRLKYKNKWLIILNSGEDSLKTEWENIAFRFDSDVKLALWSIKKIVKIYDVYNTGYNKNGSLFRDYYGCWDERSDILVVNESLGRYRRKSVLSGVVLRSSSVIQNPDIKDNHEKYLLERKPVDLVAKFSFSLFINFQQMHNFTHIRLMHDKWFGNDVGGLDGGVAKYLYEEISDLSSVVGLMKISRVEFFDFINPVYRFSTSFMFRNRGTHDLWENEFLKPFTARVWLSIIVVLILLSLLLKITNWVETMLMKSSNGSYSFITAILITISVICQQGSFIIPTRCTSRFLFFIILTLSFLLYNYYTSSIVSALLNAKPRELTTFKDLIKSGLELGMQMAPYTLTIFQTNMDPDIQAIRKLVFSEKGKPHVWNITDGLEKIRTGPYAYHVESSRAYSIIAKTFDAEAICELSDKITLIPPSYLSLYAKKDSQYKNLLKISLRRMEETGIVQRNRLIWEEKKPSCFSNAIVLSVGLDQTFIAFFILFIGLIISIALLFFERFNNHSRKLSKRALHAKRSFGKKY